METLYVTFKVEVGNEEYSYQGSRGEAEMKIQVPRSMLENFDPGPLLAGVLSAALANYDSANKTIDKENKSERHSCKTSTRQAY